MHGAFFRQFVDLLLGQTKFLFHFLGIGSALECGEAFFDLRPDGTRPGAIANPALNVLTNSFLC